MDRARQVTATAARGTKDQIAVADLGLENYLRVVCSEFQGFCADLNGEVLTVIDRTLSAPLPDGADRVRPEVVLLITSGLTENTRLSRGNPNWDNLTSDFARFGVNLRSKRLKAAGLVTQQQLDELDLELLVARNRVMHGKQRIANVLVGKPTATHVALSRIDGWRQTLDHLAGTLDSVIADDLTAPFGARPW